MNMQNNALATLPQKYKDCNLLMPVTSEVQLNPFYKITFMEVQANTKEGAGDIFKVGANNINGKWVEYFSPAKPLLMRIAATAGIQFDPNNTYGTYVDGQKNCYRAKAFGAMRMPDGDWIRQPNEKVINLSDEEDKFRLEFMDKSIRGIMNKKQGDEAAKLFKGEWRDTVDKDGKACKAFFIDESDRQKYIDRGVLVNMTQLRKTMPEKAMTGAILRVIRSLIGLKGTYTLEELKKPFVIQRTTFSPDYNNPDVRREMLSQGMNSFSGIFGTSTPAAPLMIESAATDRDGFAPEEFADNAAFQSDLEPDPQPEYGPMPSDDDGRDGYGAPPDREPSLYNLGQQQPSRASGLACSECGQPIGNNVADYSMRKFGRYLCRDHQPN